MSIAANSPSYRSGVAASLIAFLLGGGCVSERCFSNIDCTGNRYCNASGYCAFECTETSDCAPGFACSDHRCIPVADPDDFSCPGEMEKIAKSFCMDRYEASRPDASSTAPGIDESRAVSAFGVIPWRVADNRTAEAACNAAGKRLCEPEEWQLACRGTALTTYAYGDTYAPETCNGIDTYGRSAFHLMPTGAFPECVNQWGVFDLNGNLWEHTANGSDQTVRGGAFNCSDSKTLHRCDYVPATWSPSARGFRCCMTPDVAGNPNDSDIADDTSTETATGAETDTDTDKDREVRE